MQVQQSLERDTRGRGGIQADQTDIKAMRTSAKG
jgi:hypothetical protein